MRPGARVSAELGAQEQVSACPFVIAMITVAVLSTTRSHSTRPRSQRTHGRVAHQHGPGHRHVHLQPLREAGPRIDGRVPVPLRAPSNGRLQRRDR